MAKSPEKRREAYRRLREAGFSAKQANKLKDASDEKINELIRLLQEAEDESKQRKETPKPKEIPKKVEIPKTDEKIQKLINEIPQKKHGETRAERNARLREVNRILKEAGIPYADRMRLRNASPETIRKVLETRQAPPLKYGINFVESEKKRYLKRYSVVVELIFEEEDKETGEIVEVTDYITVTSNFKITKKDIEAAIEEIVKNNQKKYKNRYLKGWRIVEAYVNPEVRESPRPEGGLRRKYARSP